MTLMEVSQILRISEHTARNRLSMGLPMPPSFRVGRRRLFLKQEVERGGWPRRLVYQVATTFEPHTSIGSQVID